MLGILAIGFQNVRVPVISHALVTSYLYPNT